MARLVPTAERDQPRPLGLLRGQWTPPPDEALIGPDADIETLFYDERPDA